MLFQYLVAAIIAITPGLDEAEAEVHVHAAIAASGVYGYSPELLLAQAWVESRFQRRDFSRLECHKGSCRRVTGVWEGDELPRGAKATFYCGALQVGGYITWDRCQELMEDVAENYMAGAAHLKEWEERYVRKDPKCRNYRVGSEKRLTCALYGVGGGWKSLEQKTSTYPKRIFYIRGKIKVFVRKAEKEDQGNV